MLRRFAIVLGVWCLVLTVVEAVAADVFNMPSGQTSLQFVTVGDPGNAPDGTGYGAVSYTYQIGKYDVTAAQYVAFLNSVAKADPYGLWNSNLAGGAPYGGECGITRNGSSGNYSYAVTANPDVPVDYVTWGDAARFCNWLQNGQPIGMEGPGTTETGAYTLNGDTTNLLTQTRNAGSTYVIPTQNEWYKAAYYMGGGINAGYWRFPTRSDTAPVNILSSTGTNNANFWDKYGTGTGGYTDPVNRITPVGAFAASPGPYGTYDQGGNVWQWNEDVASDGSLRGRAGGSFRYNSPTLRAGKTMGGEDPTDQGGVIGFRVASVTPEPSTLVLLGMGAVALLGYAWRRRKHAA